MSEQKDKMYFVINHDLKMGAGKIASQVAHAMMKITLTYAQRVAEYEYEDEERARSLIDKDPFQKWLRTGGAKIILKANTEQFEKLIIECKPDVVISDAGRTRVKAGTQTVLAWYPTQESIPQLEALKLL